MVEELTDVSDIAEIELEAEYSDRAEEGAVLDDEGNRADVANLRTEESSQKGFFWK